MTIHNAKELKLEAQMPFWYFLRVPKFPSEVGHQSNAVEVREYLIQEGKTFEADAPIVTGPQIMYQ